MLIDDDTITKKNMRDPSMVVESYERKEEKKQITI